MSGWRAFVGAFGLYAISMIRYADHGRCSLCSCSASSSSSSSFEVCSACAWSAGALAMMKEVRIRYVLSRS